MFMLTRSKASEFIRTHHNSLMQAFVGIVLPLLGFGLIAEDIATKQVFPWDINWSEALHRHAVPDLDQFMLWVTRLGDIQILSVMVGFGLLALGLNRKTQDLIFLMATTVGAAAINTVLKLAFHRTRPHLWNSLRPELGFGFPSGHSMGSVTVASALIVLTWNTRWRYPVLILATILAVLIGLSRVYFGVHYPSDVLAGWAISIAWVTLVTLVLRRKMLVSSVKV